VTDREMPSALVKNYRLLQEYLEQPEISLEAHEINALVDTLTEKIRQDETELRTIALNCVQQLGFAKGTSLAFAYHLISTHHWPVDFGIAINPGKPLHLLNGNTIRSGGLQ